MHTPANAEKKKKRKKKKKRIEQKDATHDGCTTMFHFIVLPQDIFSREKKKKKKKKRERQLF